MWDRVDCFLPPTPSRTTGATPTGSVASGNSSARSRSHYGRGGSTVKNGNGEVKGSSNALEAAAHIEVCLRECGRVVAEGLDPGTDAITRKYFAVRPIGRGSKYSARIWIGDEIIN